MAWEWFQDNLALLILVAVVIIGVIIARLFRKKPKKQSFQEPLVPLGPDLFGEAQSKGIVETLEEQRGVALSWKAKLEQDSRELIAEFNKLDDYYRQNRARLTQSKHKLQVSYTTWMNQLASIEGMIEAQKKLEEQMKKLSDGTQ